MKRFRFNMEKILNLRVREEEQVRGELKAALSVVAGIERELDLLERHGREGRDAQLEERRRPFLDIPMILLLQSGLDRIVEGVRAAKARRAAAEEAADVVRERYRQARLEREQLDKIEERHRLRYDRSVRAEEMKTTNETAVGRFLKQGARTGLRCERRS